tara:strand:- start:1176 stop:3368 length:2193 start_codon:yes stop_codon:yes gene_type:complete
MRLFIAEKPELARAIVDGLGGGSKKDGYFECGSDRVTYCYGHMLSLKDPEDYDSKYAKWSLEHLPMVFIPWELKKTKSGTKQLDIILKLLKESSLCVHAGDPDPEGQLLVDEILNFVSYSKPIYRLLVNDNNTTVVRKALDNLQPNSSFRGLSEATLARMVCDQLYGYNMTRLYTLKAAEQGFQGVLSLGRVQTPVLGLVVRRDLEHEAHKKSFFYDIDTTFEFNTLSFNSKYVVTEESPIDDKKRIIDEIFASRICDRVRGAKATISNISTTNKSTPPPLPFNLLKLQVEASRKFGYKPDQVKDITQSLREKYKLITYNRSDCQYLNDEHHEEASDVLAAIGKTATMFSSALSFADVSLKSRAFNNDKVSAHHAIIPTKASAELSKLTEEEQKIYLLIARAYLAQFFPPYKFKQTIVTLECEDFTFKCTANLEVSAGWKSLYRNDKDNEEVKDDVDALALDLTSLKVGDKGTCVHSSIEQKETKPPARYTMDTLLTDLTRVAKYIKDEALRKALIERDKGKAGEHGGIGTAATRDTIISNLFERGFLKENGKSIVSTKSARDFYEIIPDQAKYPDLTAIWHQKQLMIESGELDYLDFIKEHVEYLSSHVAKVEEEGIGNLKVKQWACPNCSKPMKKLKGANGFFWGCTGYVDGCKTSLPDSNGKPVAKKKSESNISDIHKCNSCGAGLIRRKGKKRFFWGCSSYPKCDVTYSDIKGRPNYESNTKKETS